MINHAPITATVSQAVGKALTVRQDSDAQVSTRGGVI